MPKLLSTYLAELLADDTKLLAFLHDPIQAAQDNDLKKGDRAILRRVLVSASTNTPNGYALIRHTQSYRHAIRMLQNTLHHHEAQGAKEASMKVDELRDRHQEAMEKGIVDSPTKKQASTYSQRTIFVLLNGNPQDPTSGYPASYSLVAKGYAYDTYTLGDLMKYAVIYLQNGSSEYLNYGTNQEGYLDEFTVPSGYYSVPAGTYHVDLPNSMTESKPFWFYSFDGSPVYYGKEPSGGVGKSFQDIQIGSHTYIYWQVIAPSDYGYPPCDQQTAATDERLINHYTSL